MSAHLINGESAELRDHVKRSPSDSYNQTMKFWKETEATSEESQPSSHLPSRSSSRSLALRPIVNLEETTPAITPPSSDADTPSHSPSIALDHKAKRKSSRRDSTPKKLRSKDKHDSSSTSTTDLTPADQNSVQDTSEVSKNPIPVLTQNLVDHEPSTEIKVSPSPRNGTPLTSRSNSDTSLAQSKTIKHSGDPSYVAVLETPPRASPNSRKRASTGRSSQVLRISSDSPTRVRLSSRENSDWNSSAPSTSVYSSGSEMPSSPAKKQPKLVSQEVYALKRELERERTDRLVMEAMVLEHQKLIEALSTKLERQSKIILSLQQSIEIFSRPQRIAATPPIKDADRKMMDTASKDDYDEEDAFSVGPRKSKSARVLGSTASVSKSTTKPPEDLLSDSAATRNSPAPFDSYPEEVSTKKSRRKSKSSKDLPIVLDSSPLKHKMTIDTSNSSIGSDSKTKEKDRESSSGKDGKDKEKEKDKSKDKEKRKSSKRMTQVSEASAAPPEVPLSPSSPIQRVSTPAISSYDAPSRPPAPSTPTTSESKRERRKSKRGINEEAISQFTSITSPHNSTPSKNLSESASTHAPTTSTIQFDTSPDFIPSSSDRPSKSTSSRRVKLSGDKKHSTLRGEDRKKDALTDVEDDMVEKKRRKIRRTLSDPDNPTIPDDSSTHIISIVSPKLKSKSKRKSEKRSESEKEKLFAPTPSTSPVGLQASSSPSLMDKRKSEKRKSKRPSDAGSGNESTKSSTSPLPQSHRSSPTERRKSVRVDSSAAARRDSSASESFEPLASEAAHEYPEDGTPQKQPANISSPYRMHHFRSNSKKEMEEEKGNQNKRREITSPRNMIHLDLDPARTGAKASNHSLDSVSQHSPNAESVELSRSSGLPAPTSQRYNHRAHSGVPSIPISSSTGIYPSGNAATSTTTTSLSHSSEVPPLAFDGSGAATRTDRALFEQERDSREANMLSPRGRELSLNSSTAPLTARSQSNFLTSSPCNDIGIPILLEQLCKYLTAEGTACVALFEKRVDYARLEGLRRKLHQTLSNCSSSPNKLIANNLARDLKGEDPYVVAGVLKRWFLDLPDTLLMISKSRYWLDVVEITDEELCIAGLQTLYYSLDLSRRRVLRFVIDFLKGFIIKSAGITSLEDVCIRFGPLLLRTSTTSSNVSPHQSTRDVSLARELTNPLNHSNSSSNLSGSTDETTPHNPLAASMSSPITSTTSGNTTAAAVAGAASNVGTGHRMISRRGSARLEVDNSTESNILIASLMRYLVTRDSEIIKNHDEGIEFSRRPDLQYVVRCASPAKIHMLLIDQNYTEREFSQVIWDTCLYFTKPTELLSSFIALYERCKGDLKWQHRARMRILMAVKTWLKHSSFSLGPNKEFRAKLHFFTTELWQDLKEQAGETAAEMRILQSIMNAAMFERSDDTWIQWKLQRLSSCEPFTFDVQRHETSVIACQLAMIHCRLLSMIHSSELTENATLDAERSPNYTGVVQHINCVTSWVAYDVLSKANSTDRARALGFYLEIAEHLLSLGDFLGCWAIRGAFDLHPVSRLSQMWERISRKDAARNKRLSALFEPRMNFAEYRKAFDNQLNETSFAIPILAFLPKDIIRLETSEPTFPEPGLVDVDKLRSIYFVLQSLTYANAQTLQKLQPQYKPIEALWDFFANLPVIQETTLDQLSYKAEPRLTVPQSSRRTSSTSMTNPIRSHTDH